MKQRLEPHLVGINGLIRIRNASFMWADGRKPVKAWFAPHPNCTEETLQPEVLAVVETNRGELYVSSVNDQKHFAAVLQSVNPDCEFIVSLYEIKSILDSLQ